MNNGYPLNRYITILLEVFIRKPLRFISLNSHLIMTARTVGMNASDMTGMFSGLSPNIPSAIIALSELDQWVNCPAYLVTK